MRSQQVAYLVLATLTVAVLLALPAGVSARETAVPCQNAALYGQSDDAETWFRLPPYPEGREAQHIYFGNSTVEVEIHDLSTEHNFRIQDISWDGRHVDLVTSEDPAFTGIECWLVPLEVRSGIESGDYNWLSDQDPNLRYGVFTNHPVSPDHHLRRHPGRLRRPGLHRPRARRLLPRRSRTSSSPRGQASRSAPTTPTAGA